MTIQELRQVVERMPFNQILGIRIARLHSDGVSIECPIRAELRNTAGMLHGGVAAAMADAVVGIALARHFNGSRHATTVELKISYLRPISQGKAIARARLLRIGAHLCVGRVDVLDQRRQLAATALVTYMLLDS